MSDKKLNSVSSVTDAAYVYAETSNGETVKISKADLASVVAGTMRKVLATTADLNEVKTNGSYYVSSGVNAPGNYFYFEVLKTSSQDVIQVGYAIISDKLWKRTFINNSWSSWKSVTFS